MDREERMAYLEDAIIEKEASINRKDNLISDLVRSIDRKDISISDLYAKLTNLMENPEKFVNNLEKLQTFYESQIVKNKMEKESLFNLLNEQKIELNKQKIELTELKVELKELKESVPSAGIFTLSYFLFILHPLINHHQY